MDEAGRIADALIGERLAACANYSVVSSVYRWEGRVEHDTEVAMACKTRTELVPEVVRRARELHSYELPCITSWPIGEGYGPYLEWVRKETGG